jgi:hypothetical protein
LTRADALAVVAAGATIARGDLVSFRPLASAGIAANSRGSSTTTSAANAASPTRPC